MVSVMQAIEGLLQELQDEDDLARRVAAESLGTLGGEGPQVLRGAIKSQDMDIRRVALYGLENVDAPWAPETLDSG